jgi:hypothetical protein
MIYSLDDRGWSRRRIARELGIDRETVGRYLRLAKPAISTAGNGVGKRVSANSYNHLRRRGSVFHGIGARFALDKTAHYYVVAYTKIRPTCSIAFNF